MKSSNEENVYWETTIESLIRDYRLINGINVAHSGEADVHLLTFGENRDGLTRTRMEEVWTLEEVDFNVEGSSMDCFLPPGGLKEEKENRGEITKNARAPVKIQGAACRLGSSKVASLDADEWGSKEEEYEKL